MVVFNPSFAQGSDLVSVDIELQPHTNAFEFVDETGQVLPHQTIGVGHQELLRYIGKPRDMHSVVGMINKGRVSGRVIQDTILRREGNQVHIKMLLSEKGEPNLPVWESARQQIDEYLADTSITSYAVTVDSADAIHLLFSAPQGPGLGWSTYQERSAPAEEKAAQKVNPLIRLLLPLARLPFVQKLTSQPIAAALPYRI